MFTGQQMLPRLRAAFGIPSSLRGPQQAWCGVPVPRAYVAWQGYARRDAEVQKEVAGDAVNRGRVLHDDGAPEQAQRGAQGGTSACNFKPRVLSIAGRGAWGGKGIVWTTLPMGPARTRRGHSQVL